MSDTDDVGELGRRVIEKTRQSPLLERMEALVDDVEQPSEMEELRRETGDGTSMTESVLEEREERL
jgi:hypothetical protein